MTTDPGGDPEVRRRILDAALAELATREVDSFRLDGVARRAGIDVLTVRQFWASGPELFSAALLEFSERAMPVPDTGTFRGDLLEFARSFAATINSPLGRRVLDAIIVSPKDWDLSGSRQTFREARPDRFGALVHRAHARGECADGIDPDRFIDLLSSALCTPVLFGDSPISDEHCEFVVDLVLKGALRR